MSRRTRFRVAIRTVPSRLRLEWLAAAVAAMVVAATGRTLLAGTVGAAAGDRWLLVAGAVLAYEVGFLGYHLPRNRQGNGTIWSTLGVANLLTLVRGGLFATVAGFLLVPTGPATAWVPGVCYGAGAALDLLDGLAARRLGRRTELGRRLDHAFDTLGFLVAPLVGVAWGRLPVWYLSLSAARYLYRGGLWAAALRGRPISDPPPSRVRRPLAALQMAFIAGALLPVVPAGIVALLAAVVLPPSLVVFGRDFLSATGRIDRTATGPPAGEK